MNLTIDSSVFLSAFEEDDVHHQKSLEFFRKILQKESRICIPILVVAEIIHVLTKFYKKDLKTLNKKKYRLRQAFNHERYNISGLNKDFLKDFEKYSINFTNIKTADYIIALTAYITGTTCISWDKKLIKHAKKHIPTYTPSEFIKKFT